jgi:N-acetylneuraminic acid mutarotase
MERSMLRLATGPLAVITAGLVILGCKEATRVTNPASVQSAAALQMQTGDSQYATVGRPVAVNPSVRVLDDSGNPAKGVTVTFEVTSGGGSATGTEAVSDSAGFATVGSWTLGPTLGRNTLTATVSQGVDPIVFSAIALCDCWKPRASLSGPRFRGGSAVIDGKLYVVGGQNSYYVGLPLEVYDSASDTWASRGQLPVMYAGTVAALNGQLYVASGTPTETPKPWLQSYDPATDQWTSRAAPPKQRDQFRLAALNGQLYALGGVAYPGGYTRTVEAYDPATDTWTTKAPMLRDRAWMDVAVVNGILYAMGGESNDTVQGVPTADVVASVEAYDPATDAWTAKASLPVPLTGSAAAVVNGIIYVAGGGPFDAFGTVNVYAYDPSKDKWTVQPPMRTPRSDATASVLDGTIYVIGGTDSRGQGLATIEVYRP